MVRLARRWDGLAVVRKRLRKEGGNWIREPDSKEKDPVDGGDSDQAEDSGPPLNADCLKYNDTILWEMFHCWGFKPKPTVDKIEAEAGFPQKVQYMRRLVILIYCNFLGPGYRSPLFILALLALFRAGERPLRDFRAQAAPQTGLQRCLDVETLVGVRTASAKRR